MRKNTDDALPLRLVMPTNPALQQSAGRLMEKLRSHTTSSLWIAPGLSPELDELRDRQIELRSRIAAELADARDTEARHADEDVAWGEALKASFRPGAKTQSPPNDTRTSAVDRAAALTAIEERLWRAAEVLGETADQIVDTFRKQENQLLADQRAMSVAAAEERRELEEKLAAVRDKEFRAALMGQYIQREADDEAFARQPAPSARQAPARWTLPPDVLERPWHKVRAWAVDRAPGHASTNATDLSDLASGEAA